MTPPSLENLIALDNKFKIVLSILLASTLIITSSSFVSNITLNFLCSAYGKIEFTKDSMKFTILI